jgi:hypothetical protein
LAGDTHIHKDSTGAYTGAFFVYDCEGESFPLIDIRQEQPQNANYNARCTAMHAAGAAHKAAFGANEVAKNMSGSTLKQNQIWNSHQYTANT